MIYFEKILAFSIGSDFDLLEQCSQSERYRHYIKGFFILLTSIISSLFISYAIMTIFDSLIIVFLAGVLWFLINFSVTKLLLISLKSESRSILTEFFSIKTKITRLFTVLTYLIFTSLISIIISYPIIFKVFDNEIKKEINTLLNIEVSTITKLKNDEINLLKKQENILKNTIKEQEDHLHCWQKLLTSEQTGTRVSLPCGSTSGFIGYSVRSKEIEKILLGMKNEIDFSKTSLNKLKANNSKKIEKLDIKYDKIINETKLNYSSSFLLKSIALQKISDRENLVAYFKYIVFLFFIIFNMSPFFIILIDTKTGNYEYLYEEKVRGIFQNNYKKTGK